MNSMIRALFSFTASVCLVAALQGCGGGGGGGGAGSTSTPTPATAPTTTTSAPGANVVPVTVKLLSGSNFINVVYATVTVCAPDGSNCVTVPNVMVDTASTGLRLNASALTNLGVLPRNTAHDGNPLSECYTFLDGYFWGSVRTATVQLGGETATSVPIQVVNDPVSGTTPTGCMNAGSTAAENTPALIPGNGVIGVQGYLQDCGSACATNVFEGAYYSCPSAGCAATTEALAGQIVSPTQKVNSTDTNGVVLRLPAIDPNGALSVDGTLLLGVGTQANNAINGAAIIPVDSSYAFTATYKGTTIPGSFVDSGSNGFFFHDASIPTCSNSSWLCPASDVTNDVTFTGGNGASYGTSFTVRNAMTLFGNASAAYNDLAGDAFVGSVMDFGLAFFYGKDVYVVNEGASIPGTSVVGPANAFAPYTSN